MVYGILRCGSVVCAPGLQFAMHFCIERARQANPLCIAFFVYALQRDLQLEPALSPRFDDCRLVVLTVVIGGTDQLQLVPGSIASSPLFKVTSPIQPA